MRGHFGFRSTEQFCQVFLCLPSSLGLDFKKKGEKEVKEEENVCGAEGETTRQFSHAYISAYADNLPVCCTFTHTFQNPSETIPSLSLKNFKKKKKTKKPSSIRYYRPAGTLRPWPKDAVERSPFNYVVNEHLMTAQQINSPTLDMEKGSGAV